MGAVLGPVPPDDLVLAVVSPDGEGHLENVVALLHQRQDALNFGLALVECEPAALHFGQVLYELVLDQDAGPVEEILHHVEEARVGVGGHVFQSLRDYVVGVAARLDGRGGRQLQQSGDLQLLAWLQFRQRF